MGNLTSTLTISLNDDVSGKANRAGAALRSLGASGEGLKKLAAASPETARLARQLDELSEKAAKLAKLREASRALDGLSVDMKAARQGLAGVSAELDRARAKAETLKGVKGAEAERRAALADVRRLERAERMAAAAVAQSQAEFKAQGQAVRALRADLTAAGVPLSRLKAAEEDLGRAIARTNAEIARQPALLAAAQAQAARSAAAMRAHDTAAALVAQAKSGRPAAAAAASAAVEAARARRAEARDAGRGGGVVPAETPALAKGFAERRRLQAQGDAIAEYRAESRALKVAGLDYRKAQADLRALKAEMARAPSDATAARLGAAQAAVVRAGEGLRAQAAAARSARAALTELGLSVDRLCASQAALPAAINRATAAIQRQAAAQARSAERREALGTMAAGAGVVAGHQAGNIGRQAVLSVASFDLATRAQRVYTDVTERDQDEILLPQAKRIGQETKFSNEDVVKAQTKAMQGLPASFDARVKAEVAQGIVENVKHYALLMETDLATASEAIRSYLQTTGKDISTKGKALGEANKAVNQMVAMAKAGGMSADDVQQYINYASAPDAAAGMRPETMMAMGALARIGGLRGDVAGVAMRSMASKLVAPTRDGIAALNAAGIKHSDYVKMPDRLSTEALEGQFRLNMGKGFTPAIRKKIEAINSNKELIADRGKYTEAVTEAVSPILGRSKNGKVRASDAKVAAKAAGQFHKLSATEVDVEGLIRAAFEKKMSLAQLNAWLTDKHGGKAAITQKQWDEFKPIFDKIVKAGQDKEFAKRKADELMAGIGGSFENLKGSIENFYLSVGLANQGLLKFGMDALGNGIDQFSKLPLAAQQIVSLGAGAAAAAVALRGAYVLTRTLLGLGGAAALGKSALALDGSAAALTRAALALQGRGALGAGAPSAAAAAAAAAAAPGAGAALAAAGVAAGVVLGGAAAANVANNIVRSNPEPFVGLPDDTGFAAGIHVAGREGDAARERQARAPAAAGDAALDAARGRGVFSTRERGWLEWLTNPEGDAPPKLGQVLAAPTLAPPPPAPAPNPKAVPLPPVRPANLGAVPAVPLPPTRLANLGAVPTVPARPEGAGATPTPYAVVPQVHRAGAGWSPEEIARASRPQADRPPAERRPEDAAGMMQPLGHRVPAGGTGGGAASPVDAGAIARATEELARYRAELSAVKADQAATAALGMPGLGEGLAARRAELEGLIANLETRLQALNGLSIAPNVDHAPLDGLGTASDGARDKLAALDGMSVSPTIDASSIRAFVAEVERALGKVAQLGTAVASARSQAAGLSVPAPAGRPAAAAAATPAPSSGVVRRTMSNTYA
ncbi:phage tail tape measure protein [uncultured Methylobacterium sp.]|jgi:hypothetical protein|uniref:phage tail tape measure protein n=1 Tax=uncultured Methylobacterium sp. TaxID=157278 RepID=UPI002623D096|nr:phage tail tape measure protein [uncultured Methylobacterium sp.]